VRPGGGGERQRQTRGRHLERHRLALVQPRRQVGDVESERAQRSLQITLAPSIGELDAVLSTPFAKPAADRLDGLTKSIARLPGLHRAQRQDAARRRHTGRLLDLHGQVELSLDAGDRVVAETDAR
jgi:hypothetical protein